MQDEELIHGLKSASPEALAVLMDRYGDRLARSAAVLCGDSDEAQDLTQETFLQALRSASDFRGEARLYTWLCGILLNLARRQRRKAARLSYREELPDQAAPAAPPTDTADPATPSAEVLRALDRLSPEQREVVVLRYYEELSLSELAECLGVPVGTVKSRLHYALRELRRILPESMNFAAAEETHP